MVLHVNWFDRIWTIFHSIEMQWKRHEKSSTCLPSKKHYIGLPSKCHTPAEGSGTRQDSKSPSCSPLHLTQWSHTHWCHPAGGPQRCSQIRMLQGKRPTKGERIRIYLKPLLHISQLCRAELNKQLMIPGFCRSQQHASSSGHLRGHHRRDMDT